MTMLQDSAGNTSSKRVIGLASFCVAAVLAGIGIFMKSEVAADLVWPFVSLAAAILGVSVFEKRP